jgi:hypothetical protein
LIEREGEMIDPEMSGRLGIQVFSTALKGFAREIWRRGSAKES